jgi:hypothetical protein
MKIICFSSHTATWYFAFAEAVIACALQKKGHEVLFITPGNQFSGITSLRQEKILREEFSLHGYEIGTVLSKKDLKEIALIIKKLNRKNFGKLVIGNIQIGKIALYEFLLRNKKIKIEFSIDEWKECISEIENTLVSFYACRNILKKENPDRILMYSTLYSVNHVWELNAKQKSIPVYFMHHGSNLSDIDNTLIIAKNNAFFYLDKLKNYWSKLKDIPVNQELLSEVTDHFLELLKGKHYLVYSSPKSKETINIRKIFNINENQKILTATMSSYDEMVAAKYVGVWKMSNKPIFQTQIDWIKTLVKYMRQRQDLFLLIRVHPREFPNKRDSLKSEHAKVLGKVLRNLPDNVKVNWPTDKISIYDLAEETSVFLNAWSSVGLEMSLLGVPVVIYSKEFVLYPSDINYLARNRKDYFAKIELALKDGWSYKKIKKVYRWLALHNGRAVVRFRKKQTEIGQLTINGTTPPFLSNFYNSLSPKVRSYVVKLAMAMPGIWINRRQRDECRRQLMEKVDISNVEKMLLNSDDTLVEVKKTLTKQTMVKEEDCNIRKEVKRIFESMYGMYSRKMPIKKGGLQDNLRNVFTKK